MSTGRAATTDTLASWDEQDRYCSARELCEQAGISYRKLDYWTRLGFLRERYPDRYGSGTIREYPRGEVPVARALAVLSEVGAIGAGDEVARHVREHGLTGRIDLLPGRPGLVVLDLEVL